MTVIKLVEGRDGVFMTPEDARTEAWEHLAKVVAETSASMEFLADSSAFSLRSFRSDVWLSGMYGMAVVRPQPIAVIGGV